MDSMMSSSDLISKPFWANCLCDLRRWNWSALKMSTCDPITAAPITQSQRGYSRSVAAARPGVITAYVSGGLIRAVNGYIKVEG